MFLTRKNDRAKQITDCQWSDQYYIGYSMIFRMLGHKIFCYKFTKKKMLRFFSINK